MNDNLLIGRPSVFAFWALIITITILAAVGILSEHSQTASVILVAIAGGICMWTALAALTNNKKKANRVLTTAAVLSTVAALLVREADTIQQLITDPDAKTAISGTILVVAAVLTYVIHRYNREDD